MGECCKNEQCESTSQKECTTGSGCEMTDMLIGLADRAWEELMVEKMKKAIEAKNGPKMDTVAQAGVNASFAKWEHQMAGKAKCHEAKEKIKQAFMG